MRLLSIASGSSGNSIYVGDEDTHILVDSGISKKRIEEGIHKAQIGCEDLDAILITHEHSDHIRSLGVMARRYHLPIYATAATLEAIRRDPSVGTFEKDLCIPIRPDEPFSIGSIGVTAFRIYHDAADPVGFRLSSGSRSVAVSTDIGHYDQYLIDHLQGLDALLIEANHDIRMLEAGPYPYYLKRRILGELGHMSNDSCGRLLCSVLHDKLKYVLLGHLSKENNYPDLAWETVRCEIHEEDCGYEPGDFDIRVAGRDAPGEVLMV